MKYVVAVSGGVDSVALLHMLYGLIGDEDADKHSDSRLVVAHFDHGIRSDSHEDAELVRKIAKQYGLPFETTRLELGAGASEELARNERYKWLDGIKQKHGADAVATAHHQDDLLETILLNFQRGTGWRGLASLRSEGDRYRPLLALPKASLVRYALEHGLEWREDSTNEDIRYARNYIRHAVLPKLSSDQKQQLFSLAQKQHGVRGEIEKEVLTLVGDMKNEVGLSRHGLIMSPDSVMLEVLRHATNGECEPAQLRRLLHFAKTGRQGAVMQVGSGKNALLTRQRLII